jgi:gas vesicle protein
MANRDGFTGGFLLGTLVGSAIGAALGVTLANRYGGRLGDREDLQDPEDVLETDRPELPRDPRSEARIEQARQGLEDKIAQLNETIDDVRRQLNSHNGRGQVSSPSSLSAGGLDP